VERDYITKEVLRGYLYFCDDEPDRIRLGTKNGGFLYISGLEKFYGKPVKVTITWDREQYLRDNPPEVRPKKAPKPKRIVLCKSCGVEIQPKGLFLAPHRRYCSEACRAKDAAHARETRPSLSILTDSERLAISQAARGMVSGRLKEWPTLQRALEKLNYRFFPSANVSAVKIVCERLLAKETK